MWVCMYVHICIAWKCLQVLGQRRWPGDVLRAEAGATPTPENRTTECQREIGGLEKLKGTPYNNSQDSPGKNRRQQQHPMERARPWPLVDAGTM